MKTKLLGVGLAAVAILSSTLLLPGVVHADLIELTARPATGDVVDWGQLGTPNLTITSPQNFTSTGGTTGSVNLNGTGFLVQQCCIGITGTFNGNFAPGDKVLVTGAGSSLTINFNTPVQTVGAQIQDNRIGDLFIAEILAFNGNVLLGTFTKSGFSGDVGNNSNIFLGVQDSIADITSVTYLTFTSSPEYSLQAVAINQLTIGGGNVTVTPLPAALPLFATGLGVLGLLGWRKKRSQAGRSLTK